MTFDIVVLFKVTPRWKVAWHIEHTIESER